MLYEKYANLHPRTPPTTGHSARQHAGAPPADGPPPQPQVVYVHGADGAPPPTHEELAESIRREVAAQIATIQRHAEEEARRGGAGGRP
eukprot:gene13518-9951_t